MNGTTNHKWKGNKHALACPYCRGGMYWDHQDHCWLCIICGHREHKKSLRASRVASMKFWNKVFDN